MLMKRIFLLFVFITGSYNIMLQSDHMGQIANKITLVC
ncbi:MAG: hypothetical protein JWQ38_2357 [Flavipsychrobacter sp.]|nr:hypothetical protein [Flavipsychrobacter sp.]